MKATYQNRYGDNIVFEKVDDNTVKMSGFKSEWVRYGYPNVYDDAYSAYCKDNENPMSLKKFKEKIHEWKEGKINPLKQYQSLVYSDISTYDMIDPSGGPYISVGANLKHYFNDKKDMIVESISLDQSGAVFKIK
jgi:hypothetical protein